MRVIQAEDDVDEGEQTEQNVDVNIVKEFRFQYKRMCVCLCGYVSSG